VRAAREHGVAVSTVPAPCAAIAALSIAGLPCERFAFEGFLPPKAAARRDRLVALAAETRTLVFYESKHRIVESLQDLVEAFGPARRAAIARELTKGARDRARRWLERFVGARGIRSGAAPGRVRAHRRGRGRGRRRARRREGRARSTRCSRRELPPGKAAKLAAAITGAKRNALYRATG
jgi:16S rRNA (cytidine1402-2'-O)-methyltransferase